jgi:hypothetical protein
MMMARKLITSLHKEGDFIGYTSLLEENSLPR